MKKIKLESDQFQQQKGILKLTIRDTGSGIREEDISKLFNIFTQVGENSSRRLGTGLGLFICKHLVKKMNGDIRIYSQFGVGTVIIICIPIQVPQQAEEEIEMELEVNRTASRRKLTGRRES
mmetsp:Transcript_17371/g.15288  ORF Transcript_17371/g.15288 Transcript_17371/m.15288 type:complete len:122 (+) Transcript_17371:804-1169(+)